MASSTYLQDMACGDIGAQHVLRQLPRPRVDQPIRQRGAALEVMHDITAIHVPKPYTDSTTITSCQVPDPRPSRQPRRTIIPIGASFVSM